MVQTRLNSSPIEDPALSQALENNNRSTKSNSYEMIPKTSQGSARGDALSKSKSVQLPCSQGVPENPDTMGAKDSIEVDVLLDNKKSDKEEKIAAKIEWLKKKQKKLG